MAVTFLTLPFFNVHYSFISCLGGVLICIFCRIRNRSRNFWIWQS